MTYLNPAGRAERYTQKATYWAQKKQDGYGGETWETPTVIDCRWEDAMVETLSVAYRIEGESVTSNAHVYTRQPLREGGYLFKGVTVEADPSRMKHAYVIRNIITTPGLKADFFEYVSVM